MTIKYSIVIPTRNKAEYLPFAIQSVLDSPRSDIELIVSNNFSTDATAEILDKILDPRIRVVGPSMSLPMAGHYEFAISHAKGVWITILGDDDAVMPYIFESLDKLIDQYTKIDIISSTRAYYFWSGCDDLYGANVISYASSCKAQVRSTSSDLLAVLMGLRSCYDMPQIYTTCIVKRSLYEEIKDKSGGYFYHSIIPDMYSVVALALTREQYLRISEPLFWVGSSNKSMGRSDRIYRDSQQYIEDPAGQYAFVPSKISDGVSYALHSSGFSSMYIYECLLQCPFTPEEYMRIKFRVLVLAAVLNDLKCRKIIDKYHLLREITSECFRLRISEKQLKSCAFLLRLYRQVLKLISLPNRVLMRLSALNPATTSVRLVSANRLKFPTVLDATNAIMNLRALPPNC
jgi:glycosyltransferase involved in cell wall biosynthesis